MIAVARISVNHDGEVVLPLIPLFGIRAVGQKLVNWYVLLPSCLVVLVGFCLVGLALIRPS